MGEQISLVVDLKAHEDVPELVLGYVIKDRLGQPVYGTNTHHLNHTLEAVTAGSSVQYRFGFLANLGVGSYSISVAAHTADTHIAKNFEWRDLALVFNVVNIDKSNFVGVTWLPPTVECRR